MDDKSIYGLRCNHPSNQENQSHEISNSPHDPESSAKPIQTSVEAPPDAPEQPDSSLNGGVEKSQTIAVARKDKRRLHSMHHAILSRYPLEALARLGENIRQLRSLERSLRAGLKPSGFTGDILFDRLWSSYLCCLLAVRAEATAFAPIDWLASQPRCIASRKEAEVPTLML